MRLPEFRAPLIAKHERIRRVNDGDKIRRVLHSCGHYQGHAIPDGYQAPDEYKRFHREPCGACARRGEGSYDGPDLPDEDEEANHDQ